MTRTLAVTGANSAVGCCLLAQPADETGDVSFIACVRSERAESQLPELRVGSRAERVSYDGIESLARAFAACCAVVHLPGLLIERADSGYEEANVQTTQAVVGAAVKAGTGKLILVSAIGADEKSPNRYYRTKAVAERLVRESGIAFTILRVPLVLGPGTEGSEAILRHARGPRARMLGGGRHQQQPLDVADLACAILRASLPGVADDLTLKLGGPEALPERELVLRTAALLESQTAIGSFPIGLARLVAGLRTWLRGPGFSPDAIEVITANTEIGPGAADTLGIALTPLEVTLQRMAQAAGS